MRTLHLYELEWKDAEKCVERNRLNCKVVRGGKAVGYRVIAATKQIYSNAGIRNLYNYLRASGKDPYMDELPNGDIRIQYFNKQEIEV